jgi:microsomal dipeptidase-like Zn-dependent dipeptidase
VLADLHAHYPMHLRAEAEGSLLDRIASAPGRWETLDTIRSFLVRAASRVGNYPSVESGPRVTIPLLEAGNVGVAMSVLYSPFDEMDLGKSYGSPPDATYFPTLLRQLEGVEAEIERDHQGRARVVHTRAELEAAMDAAEVALVHAVEGGFQLGATTEEIDSNVAELARRGCFYVTIAHLFYRSVATNVNAIPFLPDRVYRFLFPMPEDVGLTALGRAVVTALVRERVLVDVSHMDEHALDDTFSLLDELDPGGEVPVIASHGGYRFGTDPYNLSAETIEKIVARGGVVGLILAEHQAADGLGHTESIEDSLAVLHRHVDRLHQIAGSHRHTAIGTDLDGFIKPTLARLDTEADMRRVEQALIQRYGAEDAELIASANVLRLARTYWRGAAPEPTGAAP